jgi:hypothetical protein
MATRNEYFDVLNQLAQARSQLADLAGVERTGDPRAADLITKLLADAQDLLTQSLAQTAAPADGGLSGLIGLGPDATLRLGEARTVPEVAAYDEAVTADRLLAIADLYYIYQHERLGIFRAVLKLQELFRAGQVRLSNGTGAVLLYQYDRKRALQYTRQDRMQAYRRVFGYTNAPAPAGSRPNEPFHKLFHAFNTQVAQFFRDKRVSEVIRPENRPDTFGSVAVVRRSGLDLRGNLKHASYGHVNVLTVEVSQLLERAFQIMEAADVRNLFGASNGWDAFEEILTRYLHEPNQASQRSRMATSGREILRWLAQPFVLNRDRSEFEVLLGAIGEFAEEWVTSAEALGADIGLRKPATTTTAPARVLPLRARSAATTA